jgi:hypothetical protein
VPGRKGKGPGQGPAKGPGNGSPRHVLDTSSEAQSARINKYWTTVREKIASARDALGVEPCTRPMNKAEIRDLAALGSPVAIASLIEVSADDRVSPDARNIASNSLLKFATSDENDQGSGTTINIVGGLPKD